MENYVNMTDINSRATGAFPEQPSSGPNRTADHGPLPDPRVVRAIELMFFAYRDFTAEPDEILKAYDFGRAHHRMLHFVDRYPGMRVADLLRILKITKQSVSRVLNDLTDQGFIERRAGEADRRERLLFTTGRGADLARRLMEPQLARVGTALANGAAPGAGSAAHDIEAFLLAIVKPEERAEVMALIGPHREVKG